MKLFLIDSPSICSLLALILKKQHDQLVTPIPAQLTPHTSRMGLPGPIHCLENMVIINKSVMHDRLSRLLIIKRL
jgi:hypothetical protein